MQPSVTRPDPVTRELWGHPVGLYVLFLSEMWERFSGAISSDDGRPEIPCPAEG